MSDLRWGTYGKGGVEHCGGECPEHRLRWVKLEDAETEHLQAILRTQGHVYNYPQFMTTIYKLLQERGVEPATYDFEADAALRWAAFEAGKAYRRNQNANTN